MQMANDASSTPRYRRKAVGVIGSSQGSRKALDQATEIGQAICRLGAHLVCGGMGGVMEAACQGFVEERHRLGGRECGTTIGIIPTEFKKDANPYVDLVIPSGMGIMRNMLIVQTADVVLSVAGGSGTLNEMAGAWQKGKTIIALSSTGGWSEEMAGKSLDGRRPDPIIDAPDVDTARDKLEQLIGPEPDRD
jgi:uncharacterized protein (TIGR00725 family)